MNDLMLFKNESFGQVRTIEIDGKIYFVASDIAKALKYSRPNDAINDHCPHTVKRSIGVQTGTKKDGTPAMQIVEMNVIPEGDVYRLIVNSKLPSAEKFERWVFDEVLPSIRQTGAYGQVSVQDLIKQIPIIIRETVRSTIEALDGQLAAVQNFSAVDDTFKTNLLENESAEISEADNADVGFWLNILIEWREFRMKKSRALADREYVELVKEKYPDCKISQRGLYRKWKRFKENGRQGLIDGRGRHQNHYKKNVEPDFSDRTTEEKNVPMSKIQERQSIDKVRLKEGFSKALMESLAECWMSTTNDIPPED